MVEGEGTSSQKFRRIFSVITSVLDEEGGQADGQTVVILTLLIPRRSVSRGHIAEGFDDSSVDPGAGHGVLLLRPLGQSHLVRRVGSSESVLNLLLDMVQVDVSLLVGQGGQAGPGLVAVAAVCSRGETKERAFAGG